MSTLEPTLLSSLHADEAEEHTGGVGNIRLERTDVKEWPMNVYKYEDEIKS